MKQQPLASSSDDIELLRSAAVAAGVMALGFFRREMKSWTKDNASPVTEADVMLDDFLKQNLLAARPGYGWLSEESVDDPARLEKERLFVVDPIDGTRGFMGGKQDWCICAAVVERGQAVSGVIYAPARDELYDAVLGGGAHLNAKPLTPRPPCGPLPLIPAPKAVHNELREAGIEFETAPNLPSLALRLVQVATGAIDVAVSRRGARDWDIAAADIILHECGIALEDVCAGRPVFNRPETRHGALAAMRDNSLKARVHDSLKRVYGCPEIKDKTWMEPAK